MARIALPGDWTGALARQRGPLRTYQWLWLVLCTASALVVAAAIGVLAGTLVSSYVNPKHLQIVAGIGFILIGAWTLRVGLAA